MRLKSVEPEHRAMTRSSNLDCISSVKTEEIVAVHFIYGLNILLRPRKKQWLSPPLMRAAPIPPP